MISTGVAGELVIHGKGARVDRLPLPVDVGEALVAYLRRRPASSESRAVFLKVLAPAGPLDSLAVQAVVRDACWRAGVSRVGAHRLRHTAATEMLRAGASLAGDRAGAAPPPAADDRDLRQGRPHSAQGAGAAVAGRCGMSDLRAALHDYLKLRRQLGFELKTQGRLLESYVRFMERAGAEHITTELALVWAKLPVHARAAHVASAARDRSRVRALHGDDRPAERGAIHRPAARPCEHESRHTSTHRPRSPR